MSLSDYTIRPIRIVSGSSSVIFTEPNTFTLRLPQAGFRTGKDEVCLKSLTVYYSWFNIMQEKGNNQFSYHWPGAGDFPVVLADGIWSFDDMMAYLRMVMRKNGHYLVDQTGAEQYYLNLVLNPVLYCLSLTATPLPTVLPEGWENPANVDLAASAGQTPQLIVPSGFSKVTGFATGTYPSTSSTTIYQVNSGRPQITDVTALNLLSNLCDSTGFSFDHRVLASFVQPAGRPGALITIEPAIPDWVPVQQQQDFSEITLSLVDQLMRPVHIQDPTGMVAILNVRRRRD
jgi:hypothetical protein